MLLPALVFSQQGVAICAVVLCHVERRAAKWDQTTWPAPDKIQLEQFGFSGQVFRSYTYTKIHMKAQRPHVRVDGPVLVFVVMWC